MKNVIGERLNNEQFLNYIPSNKKSWGLRTNKLDFSCLTGIVQKLFINQLFAHHMFCSERHQRQHIENQPILPRSNFSCFVFVQLQLKNCSLFGFSSSIFFVKSIISYNILKNQNRESIFHRISAESEQCQSKFCNCLGNFLRSVRGMDLFN